MNVLLRPICWIKGHDEIPEKWIVSEEYIAEWHICCRCGRRKLLRNPKSHRPDKAMT